MTHIAWREQKIIRLCQPVEVVVVEVHVLIAAVNILLPADIVRVGFVEIRELRQDCAAVLLVAYLEEAGVNITGNYRLNMRKSGCKKRIDKLCSPYLPVF